MPGTFSQIYIQYVFAVKGRENLIRPEFESEVYKYIAGIVKGKEQKPLAVNGMPDHNTYTCWFKTRYENFGSDQRH